MSAPRKVYRIEATMAAKGLPVTTGAPAVGVSDEVAARRHQEILDAIAALAKGSVAAAPAIGSDVSPALLAQYRDEIKEAAALKHELDLMQKAIAQTKQEIVALHYEGASAERIRSVTDELDEVVAGTEAATDTILAAAEIIDNHAANLTASLKDGADVAAATEIQENVIQIFEACNFQDITGQRITKVVKALQYIEERVSRMLEIWGESSFAEIARPEVPEMDENDPKSLLHGPSKSSDEGRASQDEIDALFD